MPAAVGALEAEEDVESVRGARVVELAGPGEDQQRLRDLVVPVGRVVRDEPSGMDRLSGRERAEEVVLEEELRGAVRALLRPRLAGGEPVLVQAPHRRERLVEGGAPAGRLLVAVPAAVGPLPLGERARQELDPRVVAMPSRQQTASAFPSCDPQRRVSPSMTWIRCGARRSSASRARSRRPRAGDRRPARRARRARRAASARRPTSGTGARRNLRRASGRAGARARAARRRSSSRSAVTSSPRTSRRVRNRIAGSRDPSRNSTAAAAVRRPR